MAGRAGSAAVKRMAAPVVGSRSRVLARRTTIAAAASTSVKQMASQMRDMRQSMEEMEDERLKVLMAGLRGANMNSDDFASSTTQMNLVEVDQDDGHELPITYDPDAIALYW